MGNLLITLFLGNNNIPPTFFDSWNMEPQRRFVGLCISMNVVFVLLTEVVGQV